jgi:4-hydroxy-tetrahydrodipicolinate reductase
MTRILIVGYGRMGKLVESLAGEHRCEVVGVVRRGDDLKTAPKADVAIDFSNGAAVAANLEALGRAGTSVLIGTTGWTATEDDLRGLAEPFKIGVLAAANFSIGMHIFRRTVAEAASRFAGQSSYTAAIHDVHHAQKKDAPSGTALLLKQTLVDAGYDREITVTSERVGEAAGTHSVTFNGVADSVTLTHAVRDRAVFAHGALDAAQWLDGRLGWFSLDDFLEGRSTWKQVLRGRE